PKLTTPDSPELFGLISEMRTSGLKALSMEVSSHSIAQKRISGIHFSIGIFTCIGRDHLEFHKTQEEYERVKMSFFTEILPGSKKLLGAVINGDDDLGRRIAGGVNYRKLTFSMQKGAADVFPLRSRFGIGGIDAAIRTPAGDIEIRSELTGRFNLMNLMSAAAAGILAGMEPRAVREGLESVKEIPGRLQRVRNEKGVNVFVDYSHTPRAIENVLASLRPVTEGRLIFIGGAGGDRDPGKRPLMGIAAYKGSDLAIITSDNPRSEDPEKIISQIVQGILKEKEKGPDRLYCVEPDRRKAIQKGLEIAGAGDTVVICGKGHECYQILKDRTIRFSDVETAREILNG
ncbi:MAG: UDP-N-acetylmuramoyl-L-alanyl-D-glutamate--2,6-diaminopimelate ligase, partial [Deltaproteobacteria bacterium]|nr:UDP-N-acetylmuramoyl-L-alanyl-D-glutamate--2,6-diaminopimelate ligase [Deltaproteobacteria bacterium]